MSGGSVVEEDVRRALAIISIRMGDYKTFKVCITEVSPIFHGMVLLPKVRDDHREHILKTSLYEEIEMP
jgi:hypothetical protein